MEALVPAFLAAILAQFGDRGPWLAAVLADRHAAPRRVILGFLMAHLAGLALAVAIGSVLTRILPPGARLPVLGLSILFAAGGMAWRQPPLDRLEGWRIGAVATAALGAFILALGDRTQFLALGLSAWSTMPVMAWAGALAGAMVPTVAAVNLGERRWRALPHRAISIGGSLLFAAIGVMLLLSASGLV